MTGDSEEKLTCGKTLGTAIDNEACVCCDFLAHSTQLSQILTEL